MIWVGEVLWGKGVKYFDMGKTGHDLTPPQLSRLVVGGQQ